MVVGAELVLDAGAISEEDLATVARLIGRALASSFRMMPVTGPRVPTV